MKKVLYIVLMVVSLIGLVACNDEPIKDLNELMASIELGYQNGEDPVSDFELSRNSKIYNIQSNRNPFIDHPELVDILFS